MEDVKVLFRLVEAMMKLVVMHIVKVEALVELWNVVINLEG